MRSNSQDKAFTAPRRTLFGMLSHNLFGAEFTPPPDTDWVAVFRESCTQAVHVPAFHNCHKWGVPSAVRQRIKPILRAHMLRNARSHALHTELHGLLTAHGVSYCMLKGAVSAYYYPEPSLRCMGDVDFYIHPSDIRSVCALMTANGFEIHDRGHPHHMTAYRQKHTYELHFEMPGIPDGPAGEVIRRYQATLCEESVPTETEQATFVRPSDFHHGLIMLLHMQQHLLNEGIGLRHLCDWAVFVDCLDRPESDAFARLFRDRLEAAGLWRFACLVSLACERAVGLPHRDWMGGNTDDYRLADELLADFLAGGNFGVMDTGHRRVYAGQLVAGRDRSSLHDSGVKNGVKAVNDWIRRHWKAAARWPVLLPFGWVWFTARRFALVISGKRKRIKPMASIKDGRERQRLYRNLHLFEIE